VFEILGLKDESGAKSNEKLTEDLIKIIVDLREGAKKNKDWTASDKIRKELNEIGITLKDKKDGVEWER
jgi:cysteinyl-tRNA synthetase